MILVTVRNHGLSLDAPDPRTSPAAALAQAIRNACLDVVSPINRDSPILVEFLIVLACGRDETTPMVVTAEALSWPTEVTEIGRQGLTGALADAIVGALRGFFQAPEMLWHVSVRAPGDQESAIRRH